MGLRISHVINGGVFLAFIAGTHFSNVATAAIYSHDSRLEAHQHSLGRSYSGGTALMVSKEYLSRSPSGQLGLDFRNLQKEYGICADESFVDQPVSPITCTGFLIAPDILVTAGHCALNIGEVVGERTPHCETFSWLFDYELSSTGDVPLSEIEPKRMYHCKEVMYATHDADYIGKGSYTYRDDFAIIRLDRKTQGRHIFKIASDGLQSGAPLSMLGYPLGLPAKIAFGSVIKASESPHFLTASLDAQAGNSGSPVLNPAGGVLGFLVRSFPEKDFYTKTGESCRRPNLCKETEGGGVQCDVDVESPGREVGAEIQKFNEAFSLRLKEALKVQSQGQ